jgi:rhomboid protease GluP
MLTAGFLLQTLHDILKLRNPEIWVTKLLIAANVLVFGAMLLDGTGLWHSTNSVQLIWGANFGPATQDGEWWRLASAMFLHFGALHLLLNMWALWDAGQWVERMYGYARFASIYIISGLAGNLLSLVVQGNSAISGGASGAIFGIYGALLAFLWRERKAITPHEFRWLFWGALGFSIATIILGFIVPGIDNSAHIGGFISGILASIVFSKSVSAKAFPIKTSFIVACGLVSAIALLVLNIPAPKYHWSDELLIRKQIDEFLQQDQAINRSWLEIMHEEKQNAGGIAALPSATKLESLLKYAQQRKDESRALADKLRHQSAPAQPK